MATVGAEDQILRFESSRTYPIYRPPAVRESQPYMKTNLPHSTVARSLLCRRYRRESGAVEAQAKNRNASGADCESGGPAIANHR